MPYWQVGNTYTVDQIYDVAGLVEAGGDDGFNMRLTSTGSLWTIGGGPDGWQASFADADFFGEGHAKLSDPLPFDADIRLGNGADAAKGSGTIDVMENGLGLTRIDLHFTGNLYADVGTGDFIQIGTADLTVTFTFDPMMEDWQWPLAAGNSWSYQMTVTATGLFLVTIQGVPLEQDFTESSTFTVQMNMSSDTQANGTASPGGTLFHTYDPTCLWYGTKQMQGFQIGQTITLTEILWNFVGCDVTVPPTPTPMPGGIDVTLDLADDWLQPGDQFLLTFTAFNPGASANLDIYCVLEVFGSFYFWPGWTQSLDSANWTLATGEEKTETILDFTWPNVSGPVNGLKFYGLAANAGTFDVVSNIEIVEWGYQ
jgi:hypothetical protein